MVVTGGRRAAGSVSNSFMRSPDARNRNRMRRLRRANLPAAKRRKPDTARVAQSARVWSPATVQSRPHSPLSPDPSCAFMPK